jgi:predicted negative regulator of RcsB-dependent stress response
VILILAGFLGWAVWKWRSTSNQQNDIEYQENNAASEKKLIDQHRSINSDDVEDV